MGLFRFTWLHRLIRKKTNPIAQDSAELWKRRLSTIYMFTAWNILGVLAYISYSAKHDVKYYLGIKSDEDRNKIPAVHYAEMLQIPKAHIVAVKHFKKVGEFDYVDPSLEDKKNKVNDEM